MATDIFFPKPRTHEAAVLGALLTGETLTTDEFYAMTGSHDLSSRVAKLNECGWPILSERFTKGKNSIGRPLRYARYRIDFKALRGLDRDTKARITAFQKGADHAN